MRKLYGIVGLGGTFDHFHAGHEHFIKFAYEFGRHLHIGITHPKLAQHKTYPELIELYETRRRAVEKFCITNQISAATSQLVDVYGPTVSKDSKIRGLVVTEDTVSGAEKINQTRQAMGLSKLPVHVCPLLSDKEGKGIINAERIRAGEINRSGEVYTTVFSKNITLNQTQRDFFTNPQGEIVKEPQHEEKSIICVVGDTSLETFIENNWGYDLGIYDKRQQRQVVKSKVITSIKPNLIIDNIAGDISPQLVKSLKEALNNNAKHLFVEGEEDLAAVALALLLPLDSTIYYGQPNQGLVMMKITEKLKNKIYQVLSK